MKNRWGNSNEKKRQVLGFSIDEIGLLGCVPLQNILLGDILVGLKNELDAYDKFVCGMYPFDWSMEFGVMIEPWQSAA